MKQKFIVILESQHNREQVAGIGNQQFWSQEFAATGSSLQMHFGDDTFSLKDDYFTFAAWNFSHMPSFKSHKFQFGAF